MTTIEKKAIERVSRQCAQRAIGICGGNVLEPTEKDAPYEGILFTLDISESGERVFNSLLRKAGFHSGKWHNTGFWNLKALDQTLEFIHGRVIIKQSEN